MPTKVLIRSSCSHMVILAAHAEPAAYESHSPQIPVLPPTLSNLKAKALDHMIPATPRRRRLLAYQRLLPSLLFELRGRTAPHLPDYPSLRPDVVRMSSVEYCQRLKAKAQRGLNSGPSLTSPSTHAPCARLLPKRPRDPRDARPISAATTTHLLSCLRYCPRPRPIGVPRDHELVQWRS
jgi:hypothetical protein